MKKDLMLKALAFLMMIAAATLVAGIGPCDATQFDGATCARNGNCGISCSWRAYGTLKKACVVPSGSISSCCRCFFVDDIYDCFPGYTCKRREYAYSSFADTARCNWIGTNVVCTPLY